MTGNLNITLEKFFHLKLEYSDVLKKYKKYLKTIKLINPITKSFLKDFQGQNYSEIFSILFLRNELFEA